jgi:hypothetical protein
MNPLKEERIVSCLRRGYASGYNLAFTQVHNNSWIPLLPYPTKAGDDAKETVPRGESLKLSSFDQLDPGSHPSLSYPIGHRIWRLLYSFYVRRLLKQNASRRLQRDQKTGADGRDSS